MSRHHTLEEKKEIIRLHEGGSSMIELMTRFHVRDHYLYILFGRYRKFGIAGIDNYRKTVVSLELKEQIIKEYEADCLPLWQLCVKYDVSHSSVCRWIRQYNSGGYEELYRHNQRGRPSNNMGRPKKKEPQTELEKLQAENLRLRAENRLAKKSKGLDGRRKGQIERFWSEVIHSLRSEYDLDLLLEIKGMARSTITILNGLVMPQNTKRKRSVYKKSFWKAKDAMAIAA